jgi:molecular chaperone DnaK
VRNHADNLVYTTEKTLREVGERVPAETRSEADGKVAALRSALTSGDIDRIKSAMSELEAVLQQVGQAVYSHSGTGGRGRDGYTQSAGEETGGDDDEGTIDGEFREV